MQGERPLALVGIQIGVARAHGQAVGLPDDRADYNLYRKIQIARQATDDGGLRGVFLSEEGNIGFDDVKEFGNHCRHPAKVAGTRSPIELLAQAFDNHPGPFALAIHLFSRRREQNVDTFSFQKLTVAVERPRILGKVFSRAKLRWIDEEGDDYRVTLSLRGTYPR